MNPLVILDCDDTLWRTSPLYTAASERVVSAVLRECPGTRAQEVRDRIRTHDLEQASSSPYDVHRFGQSLLTVFLQYVPEATPEQAHWVLDVAYQVYRQDAPVYPGVRTALSLLRRHGYRLLFYTLGDPLVQQMRMSSAGLAHAGESLCITDRKDAYSLAKLVTDPQRTWVVGNSPRSDLAPALLLGCKVYLVNAPAWAYDQHVFEDGYQPPYAPTLLEAVEAILLEDDALLQEEERAC